MNANDKIDFLTEAHKRARKSVVSVVRSILISARDALVAADLESAADDDVIKLADWIRNDAARLGRFDREIHAHGAILGTLAELSE